MIYAFSLLSFRFCMAVRLNNVFEQNRQTQCLAALFYVERFLQRVMIPD